MAELLALAVPGTAFALDEIRLSKTARYADPAITFGPQQTFNPFHFSPQNPSAPDSDTLLLLHFDDDPEQQHQQGKYPPVMENKYFEFRFRRMNLA